VYALIAHVGFGFPGLFRTDEFYIGQVRRLSGSFEYSNTAAAYFAISLPIVWWSCFRRTLRILFAFCLWCAIVLTFSKGALLAVPIAVVAKRKAAIPIVIVGVAAYAALLPFNPYLLERIHGPGLRNPIAVEYRTHWNKLQQRPNVGDVLHLQVRNTGITTLRSKGWWHSSIAYRWWNIDTEAFVTAEPMITSLPNDLHPGDRVEVDAHFQTPSQAGTYFLVFELFSRDFDWFSRAGVVPALIQADIRSDLPRSVAWIDLSAMYNRGRNPAILTAAVPRSSLWIAALRMFRRHPFGIGPDNYRLEYGKYLGASRWDTHIYSNNLYLEVLTGSGLLGFAAFALTLAARRWSADVPSVAAVVFLVHGLVDVFLMATPLYFAFWILMGSSDPMRRRREPAPANALTDPVALPAEAL
jgi:O-Antigen ligase